ncbi:hypothetical protein LTR62_006966 [Meristemomyces frigidus]|uniref:Uncharacterized protein n=1 Tax=Meristemomyces frigidus TaxID=1508187 RepID=A0AAN7TBS7_9PEZI|nr:hypothetical protein LTR62_006966 [Meristemomyces frigidus]
MDEAEDQAGLKKGSPKRNGNATTETPREGLAFIQYPEIERQRAADREACLLAAVAREAETEAVRSGSSEVVEETNVESVAPTIGTVDVERAGREVARRSRHKNSKTLLCVLVALVILTVIASVACAITMERVALRR